MYTDFVLNFIVYQCDLLAHIGEAKKFILEQDI